MPVIPILKSLENDELLYSYILRISDANGFKSVNEFLAAYIWLNADVNDKKSKRIKKDGFFSMNALLKAFNLRFNMSEFFKVSTLYSGIAPFITQEQQLYIINMTFRDDVLFLTNPSIDMIGKLKSCSECRKDEVEAKGYFWFHRSHQMPGVKKCHIHECDLQVCESRFGTEYTNPIFRSIETEDQLLDEVEYTKFAIRLLLYDMNTDFKEVKVAIYKKLTDLSYAPDINGIYKFIESIQHTGRYGVLKEEVWDELKKGKYLNLKGKVLFRIFLCYFLFDSVDEMIRYLPHNIERDLNFFEKVKAYEVYEPYHRNLVTMKHKKCNTIFLSTPYGVMSGIGCPCCNKTISQKDLITRIMSQTLGDTYKVKRIEYNSIGKIKQIEFIHSACRNIHAFSPTDLLYMGTRCECERRIPFKTIQEKIQECGPYKVVEFTNVNQEMQIKHNECGKIFKVDYYRFLREPYCRACFREGDTLRWKYARTVGVFTEEKFIEILKEMTGNEYVLDGHYVDGDTYVSIRHSICGQSRMYKPNKFTQGLRCDCNKPKLSYNAFTKLVYKLSCGKYKIIGRKDKSYYLIQNVQSGEQYQMLKSIILQELRRLDGSIILPLDKRNEIGELDVYEKNELEEMEGFIRQNYLEGEIFISSNLQFLTLNPHKRSRLLSELVKQGILKRIGVGKFLLVQTECLEQQVNMYDDILKDDFPNKIEIISRYLLRNGIYIGYLYGKSLAYELGILKEKPDKLYIATNALLFGKLERTAGKRGDILVVLRKPFTEATNDNYVILSIIDYLYSYPNYRKKYKGESIVGEYATLKSYLLKKGIQQHDFNQYLVGFSEQAELQNEIARIYSNEGFIESIGDTHLDEKLYLYLKKHFREYEIMYSKDIHVNGLRGDLSWLYKKLIDKGLLRRITRGKYVFASYYKTDTSVAEAIYKFDHVHHIGYTYGKSFRYEIGLIDEEQEKLYICTNKFAEKVAVRREKVIGNITIVIRRPIVEVSDQNYLILPILDFMSEYSDSNYRYKSMRGQEYECLRNYIKKYDIQKSTCIECIGYIEQREYLKSEIEIIYEEKNE